MLKKFTQTQTDGKPSLEQAARRFYEELPGKAFDSNPDILNLWLLGELILRYKNTKDFGAIIKQSFSKKGVTASEHTTTDLIAHYVAKLAEDFKQEIRVAMDGDELNTMLDAMKEENLCYIVGLYKLFNYLNQNVIDQERIDSLLNYLREQKVEERDVLVKMIERVFNIAHLLNHEHLCKNDLVFIMLLFDNEIRIDKDIMAKLEFVSKQWKDLLSKKKYPKIKMLVLKNDLEAALLSWSAAEKTKSHLSSASSVMEFLDAVLIFINLINLLARPLIKANCFIESKEKQQQQSPAPAAAVGSASSMFNNGSETPKKGLVFS